MNVLIDQFQAEMNILEIVAQAVNSILAEYGLECGLGWVTPVQKILGWVGLDSFAVGLG